MHFKLNDTKMLSSTTKAYVEKDQELLNILGQEHPFWNAQNALDGKRNFSDEKRNLLANKLFNQYSALSKKSDVNNLVFKNIEALRNKNTYTVTTGQQLHLFIGPAFVIYKVLAVIDYCERYKNEFPENEFIPVYWLASEDHDFEEIKHTKIFKNQFSWSAEHGGACGRIKTDSVQSIIDEIKNQVNLDDRQNQLITEIEEIYKNSETLSEATISLMNKYFGEYGLICIDADDKDFKSLFIEQMKTDILERKNKLLFDSLSEKLQYNGFSTQLNVREINFFYMSESGRKRIIFEQGKYKVIDSSMEFSPEEIENLIHTHPENFSPNAMLRPLYQETILPNMAYIGGNAEINYWIQLCNVMTSNNIAPPNLILRPSVWITSSKIAQWLEKRGIEPLQLLISEKPSDLLKFAENGTLNIENEILEFETFRKNIQNTVAQHISKELKSFVEAGKQYEKALKLIDKSLQDHFMEKNAKDMDKLEDIRINYFNINSIQERTTSALELLIKYENVVFSIKSAINLDNSFGHVFSI
ncbi:MAG: bacillithiol biosynthesis cysteine-adding enzyme BshC [Bacteroidia bacterium]|nr:bacillithiol biosynthesis cysteine-adding enzyme BshC [Bacteroidia bacterium]